MKKNQGGQGLESKGRMGERVALEGILEGVIFWKKPK